VFVAKHRLSGVRVAVKKIPKSELQKPAARTHFNNEMEAIQSLSHPFIAQFYELVEDSNNFYFVTEFAGCGELLTYANSKGRLSEQECRRIFSQILSAVAYLHIERKIVHRDLKLENVLMDSCGNTRLIDFGFARSFAVRDSFANKCGSPAYVAPEVVTQLTHTSAVDVWSLGVVL
jgi:serine/threonine protein kinase